MAFLNLDSTLDTLKTLGAESIQITYSGSGDDGAIEPPTLETYTGGCDLEPIINALESEAGDTLIAFVEHLLGPGWENGAGLDGTVLYNLVTDTIVHNQEEEDVQYNYNEDVYNLRGELLSSKTDNWEDSFSTSHNEAKTENDQSVGQKQKEYISSIETLLRQTTTERFLLDFWIKYPEVATVTFSNTIGMDIDENWLCSVKLVGIEFVSPQAMKNLKDRLDIDSDVDMTMISTWQKLLFVNGHIGQGQISEELLNQAIFRSENPEEKLREIMESIRKTIDGI